MLLTIQRVLPGLSGLIFLWFVIALVVFIIKRFGANKITDPVTKKIAVKKAWKILLYPVLVFFINVVLMALVNIAIGG